MSPAVLVCSTWGALEHGELVHLDCPTPATCPCECQTCKRAWWAAGRPAGTQTATSGTVVAHVEPAALRLAQRNSRRKR